MTENTAKNKCLQISPVTSVKTIGTRTKPKPNIGHKNLICNDCDEKEIDRILDKAVKAASTCSHHPCSKSIVVFYSSCRLCNMRFCFSHILPEVHGCGELARIEAKKNSKEKNGNSTSRSLSENDRDALACNVRTAVKQLSNSRQKKKNPKKSST